MNLELGAPAFSSGAGSSPPQPGTFTGGQPPLPHRLGFWNNQLSCVAAFKIQMWLFHQIHLAKTQGGTRELPGKTHGSVSPSVCIYVYGQCVLRPRSRLILHVRCPRAARCRCAQTARKRRVSPYPPLELHRRGARPRMLCCAGTRALRCAALRCGGAGRAGPRGSLPLPALCGGTPAFPPGGKKKQ